MALKIGWAKRDFSLDEPVQLYGQLHIRVSEGIHDPLLATALAITEEESGHSVIFLALDLECPHGGIIDEVKRLVKEACPEIPAEAIVISGTHTHGGLILRETPPQTLDGKVIYPGTKCRDHVARLAAEAVSEAWKNQKPGGIAFGYGYAVVGHSRRSTYLADMSEKMPNNVAPNGHAIMYGKTNDPDFAGYEAGADHFLNALFTTDDSENVTGIIVNIPCPGQTSETLIWQTADFWYNVRLEVEKEFGKGVFVLNQCAAGGDMAPRILHYNEAQRRKMRLKYGLDYDLSNYHRKDSRPGDEKYKKTWAEQLDIGERVITALREIWSWAKKDIRKEVPIRTSYRVLQMPRREITEEMVRGFQKAIDSIEWPRREDCRDEEEYRVLTQRCGAAERRNRRAIKRYEDSKTAPTIPMRMNVVRIGDVSFVTNRFEVYIDYMHRLQAQSPALQTFVVQLAGDEDESYLATERAMENRGYSASIYCNQVSAEAGQYWIRESLAELNKLFEK